MSRVRKRRLNLHFAMVPVEVLTSEACKTLPNVTVRLLIAIAAHYRGRNNGDLAMTREIALSYGITSKRHLVEGLRLLQERGLIIKTRQGGKRPLGPCLYAVTWMPIDECDGKLEVPMSMTPSNAWADWKASASALPGVQSAENLQHSREGSTALPGVQTEQITALPGVQKPPFLGTPGSPPSISRVGSSEALPVLGAR